jgi:hypothetical protein
MKLFPPAMDSPNFPCHTWVNITLADMLLLLPVALKLCRRQTCIYSWADHLIILEHYFTSKVLCIQWWLVCCLQYLKCILWNHCFRQQLMHKKIRLFWSNSFLYWKKLKGTAAFSMMGLLSTFQTQQLLHCKRSLVTTLLGMASYHHDHQTSHNPNLFCEDFSKSLIKKLNAAWRK